MTLKRNMTTAALIAMLGLGTTAPAFAQTALDTDGDGIPDTSEPLLGTDPEMADTDGDGQNDLQDAAPVMADNPITMSGNPAPFAIREAIVENNYDPVAKADATDHLEWLVANTGTTDLTAFSLYYTSPTPIAVRRKAISASLTDLPFRPVARPASTLTTPRYPATSAQTRTVSTPPVRPPKRSLSPLRRTALRP